MFGRPGDCKQLFIGLDEGKNRATNPGLFEGLNNDFCVQRQPPNEWTSLSRESLA